MMKTKQLNGYHKQRGAALVIALLILVVISILGVSAMRMSLFNARISTGAQANTMSFQAAETALQAVHDEALDADNGGTENVILRALRKWFVDNEIEVQVRCVTKTDPFQRSACADSDRMDSRGLLQAGSRTIVKDEVRYIANNTVSMTGGTGGSSLMVWYDFVSTAESDMVPMNVQSHNVQEFSRKGMYTGENF